MAITQFGAVHATEVMIIIEGGECVPPSMRTSGVRAEKPASAELNAVTEERGLEPRDVHGDRVGKPGFSGKPRRPLEVEPLFQLGVGGDECPLGDGERSLEHVEGGKLRRIDELKRRRQLGAQAASTPSESTMRASTSRSTSFRFLRAVSLSAALASLSRSRRAPLADS